MLINISSHIGNCDTRTAFNAREGDIPEIVRRRPG